jgi:hypothetical protein
MRSRLCALVSVILLGAGCAQPYVRQVDAPVIPAPLVQRIPLAIGVHYTSEFRAARPRSSMYVPSQRSVEEIWLLGEPSVTLFDAALRGLFDDVVEVAQWPPKDRAPAVAGVLVPSVPTQGVDVGIEQTRVRYRLELYSKHGEPLCAWEVVGVSGSSGGFVLVLGKTLVRDAMRSAAAGVMVSFFRQSEARAWLEVNGVLPDTLR